MIGRRRSHGFSMLELSVVIGIIALIVGAGITMGSNSLATAKRIQTRERLETIKYALEAYKKANGYLPCPGNRAHIPTTVDFGTSVYPCAASSPGLKSVAGGSGNLFIGAVPVRSLGLPDTYAADGWGNKFNYEVSALHTSNARERYGSINIDNLSFTGTFNEGNTSQTNPATIPSNRAAITPLFGAAWAVVSYGPDGEGAFPLWGTSIVKNCIISGTSDYAYNCYENSTLRDLPWNDGKGDTSRRYDDMVVWAGQDPVPVTTTQPPTCSTGCEAWCAPCTNDLHSGAPANMDAATRNLCRKFITSTSPCQATCLWSGTLTSGPRRVMCP